MSRDDDELLPEMVAKVQKALDDGVFLHHAQSQHRNPVDRITWRPGLENELARVIIAHCAHAMTLELDGHRFAIAPQREGPQ